MHTHIINRRAQNVIMTLKVKCQGHNTSAVRSFMHGICIYREGRQSGYFLTSRDIFIVTVLNYRSLGENNLTAEMAERDIN